MGSHPSEIGAVVLERFTAGARSVLMTARDEAKDLGHTYVGSEHILLGVLRQEVELSVPVFANLAVTADEVRASIGETMGRGAARTSRQIQLTPRAITILELSLESARQTGDGSIRVDNILIGLVREGSGVWAQILTRLGVDPAQLLLAFTSPLAARKGAEAGGALAGGTTHTARPPITALSRSAGEEDGLDVWSLS